MNELTITTDLKFNRVAKSGKVTTRGALGVMLSGNRSESVKLGGIVAQKLIDNNTFAPIMAEVLRVFAPSTLQKFGVFKVGEHFCTFDATTKTYNPIETTWGAAASKTYCECVVARCNALIASGKEVKGEKAIVLDLCQRVVAQVKAKELAKVEGGLRRAA